jgi:hypothetical protein
MLNPATVIAAASMYGFRNVAIILLVAAAAGVLLHRLTGGKVVRSPGQGAALVLVGTIVVLVLAWPGRSGDASPSLSGLWSDLRPGSDQIDVYTQTVPAAPGGKLVLQTPIGNVRVQAGTNDQVSVEVERTGRLASMLAVDVIEEGGNVTVRARETGSSRLRLGRSSATFVITVPARYSLDVNTRGGNINVGSIEGDISIATAGGSLSMENIDGSVNARTSGGSIKLGSSTGTAVLRTAGGSIRAGKVGVSLDAQTSGGTISLEDVAGSVSARTSGGSISANLIGGLTGDVSLRTSGGSIRVRAAESVIARVDASTSAGRVRSDFHDVAGNASSLREDLNGGGPELMLRTSAGSITLERI